MTLKKTEAHVQLLGTLYLILLKIRREGLMSIEMMIEKPNDAPVFNAFAPFDDANAAIYTVLCDVLRVMVGGNLEPVWMERYLNAARKTTNLSKAQQSMFNAIEITLLASMEGSAPTVAVEAGRQCIPANKKPGFGEFEDFLHGIRNHKDSVMTRDEMDAALVGFFDSIAK